MLSVIKTLMAKKDFRFDVLDSLRSLHCKLDDLSHIVTLILKQGVQEMADINTLTSKFAKLQADSATSFGQLAGASASIKTLLANLIAELPNPDDAAKFQALSDGIDDLDTKIQGAAVGLVPGAPTATLTSPDAGTVGTAVSLSGGGTAVAPATRIMSWKLDYGDGSTPDSGDGNYPGSTHTYATEGVFGAVLSVTDDAGTVGTAVDTITISPAA